jgi:hypothetical protein
VAITAIDAIVSDVVFMAERYRLGFDNADIRIIRAAVERIGKNKDCAGEETASNNTDLGYGVSAAMEDLCHAWTRISMTFYCA